ncbi:putative oxygenase MesX [Brevibacterium samyangense]|uniref:DUF1852 family protein n=1 Tax=Brevibacterium samyangense TaxID=366888 RepID=A0ABN2T6N6_9MICO
MAPVFGYRITTTPFDEDYTPAADSRRTTNFANLARGTNRRENLRTALRMMDARLGDLTTESGTRSDRYSLGLEIVTADLLLDADGTGPAFPFVEFLAVTILDRATGERIPGIVGNNFSSYIRDYDFSVVLPAFNATRAQFAVPEDFGVLHGMLFQDFLASEAYRSRFARPPVVCLSVSTSRTYRRAGAPHPVLGVEYRQSASSLTDDYFSRMGMQARFFMPRGAVAPLAFYFTGDLLTDHSDLALYGTISTMEVFQRIYRPEIYNTEAPAGEVFAPTLDNPDFSTTGVVYDRVERTELGRKQGELIERLLMVPHRAELDSWSAAGAR